ncbi:MAG: carboxypeptidase M32, partial [Planctomycetaceae bacterium]|nr:carboxypeptidase M32 [Planctomycetaceae bacterium]
MSGNYDELCEHFREIAVLGSIGALLDWDARCMLPSGGEEYRSDQQAYLSNLLHQKQTDPRIGDWLDDVVDSDLTADPYSDSATVIREAKRIYDKQVKLPADLVEALTRAGNDGQHAWVEARKNDDFATFLPFLETTFKLKREQADAIGFDDCRYDALLDDFEPDEKTNRVRETLEALREDLVPLLDAIQGSAEVPDASLLTRKYPVDCQTQFGTRAATAIGFEFDRGRLDVTHHPFCTEAGPDDCRITTRYDEKFFNMAFFGILHEAGHGIYDQGLRKDFYGLGPGTYLSLGIHESQSRMWENQVGRGRPFWEHWYGAAQQTFSEALGDVAFDDFYFAINRVEPSLIRVEADEVTYNLHILLRFELEQALVAGEIAVADLPGIWNERMESYLGIRPANDAEGVLQDIHWSSGLMGY